MKVTTCIYSQSAVTFGSDEKALQCPRKTNLIVRCSMVSIQANMAKNYIKTIMKLLSVRVQKNKIETILCRYFGTFGKLRYGSQMSANSVHRIFVHIAFNVALSFIFHNFSVERRKLKKTEQESQNGIKTKVPIACIRRWRVKWMDSKYIKLQLSMEMNISSWRNQYQIAIALAYMPNLSTNNYLPKYVLRCFCCITLFSLLLWHVASCIFTLLHIVRNFSGQDVWCVPMLAKAIEYKYIFCISCTCHRLLIWEHKHVLFDIYARYKEGLQLFLGSFNIFMFFLFFLHQLIICLWLVLHKNWYTVYITYKNHRHE